MVRDSEEKVGSSSKGIVILLCILVIALIGVVIFLLSGKTGDGSDDDGSTVHQDVVETTDRTETTKKHTLGYESQLVLSDADDLQDAVDEMIEKTKEGNMALEFKNLAQSSDGQNFSCYIANSATNKYDMYLAVYEDETCENELFITELIPPGKAIDSMTLNQVLGEGDHKAILMLTQVKPDHQTIHAQVAVVLTLSVH